MIGVIIVARLSSQRLPKKNIMQMAGKPMILNLIERVLESNYIEKVVVATSTESSDDELAILAENMGIDCYRGSLENVMERVSFAAREFGITTIVEILGDNPLVSGELVDDVVALYINEAADYSANLSKDYDFSNLGYSEADLFPLGVRVQVYGADLAMRYDRHPVPAGHPTSYIYMNPHEYKCVFLCATGKWASSISKDYNFAVNTASDFLRIEKIIAKSPKCIDFLTSEFE